MQDFILALSTVDGLVVYKTYPAREEFDIEGDATTLLQAIKSRVGFGCVQCRQISCQCKLKLQGRDRRHLQGHLP